MTTQGVVGDHQLYVVGRDDTGDLHPYRFSRIRAVDVLDDTFDYPGRTEYDPEQVFRDSFGIFLDVPVHDVVLKLHEQWITCAQSHRWHDSRRPAPGAAGSSLNEPRWARACSPPA